MSFYSPQHLTLYTFPNVKYLHNNNYENWRFSLKYKINNSFRYAQ